MKIKRNISITIVCLVLGIMLAWQFKSIYNNDKIDSVRSKRLEDIKDQLILEQNNNRALIKRNDELLKKTDENEKAKDNLDSYEKNLKTELERSRIIAGLTEVKGKGVVITLSNSELNSEFGMVTEDDLLRLLNELRASDAQAISINDERIISTSEIREAGKYIVINGKQKIAPFVIKAIADPDKISNALNMVGGIVDRFVNLYKLRITIEKKDNIVISKVKDDGLVIRTDLITPIK